MKILNNSLIDIKVEEAICKTRKIGEARNDVSNIDELGLLETVGALGSADNRIRLSKSALEGVKLLELEHLLEPLVYPLNPLIGSFPVIFWAAALYKRARQ